MCRQGVDLSWKAELLPTIKSLTLRLQDYPSLSHIVVYVPSVHGSKVTDVMRFLLGCLVDAHVRVYFLMISA